MNILVIMLYWYPYEGPLMPIYGAIFQDLSNRGHSVSIVTSFPHYRKGRKETWEEFRGKYWEVSAWKNVEVIRSHVFAPVFRSEKLSLIIRALNFLSFNLSSLISALLLAKKPSVIFAPSSPPLSNGLIAKAVGFFRHCPVIYNVQDLYPDMAERMELIKSRSVLHLLKTVEKIVYHFSDRVLAISGQMADTIKEKVADPKKVDMIPNFIDTEKISPGNFDNPFSRQFGLVGKFVVMYAGNIGIPHGVEVLVETAELLKADNEILFCFVARGEYKEKVENLAKKSKLTNYRFIEPQSEDMVPYIWASASVGVITYRKGLADFSVPSKLLAMMCAARPVVASLDGDSEAARIVREADCGVVVDSENPENVAKAIQALKAHQNKRREEGQNGRSYVVKHLRRKVISQQYESLFRSVVSASS